MSYRNPNRGGFTLTGFVAALLVALWLRRHQRWYAMFYFLMTAFILTLGSVFTFDRDENLQRHPGKATAVYAVLAGVVLVWRFIVTVRQTWPKPVPYGHDPEVRELIREVYSRPYFDFLADKKAETPVPSKPPFPLPPWRKPPVSVEDHDSFVIIDRRSDIDR